MQNSSEQKVLKGSGGSPGICIGKAYLVDKGKVDVIEKYYINRNGVQKEINRFKQAVKKAQDEMTSIIEGIPEEYRQHANILEIHVVLLTDKMFYDQAIEIVEKERVNAEWAIKKVTSKLKTVFQNMPDDYFSERVDDIIHVSDRVLMHLMGDTDINIADIDERVILVAHNLSPAQTSQIRMDRVKGFVTDRGGVSSHTGIIARALEIPAVLALDNATTVIENEDLLIVDGSKGEVIINPDEQTLLQYRGHQKKYQEFKSILTQYAHLPAQTTDNATIQVQGNIELPNEVVTVKNNGGDGIGLYRTEFQYLSRSSFPQEDELYEKYNEVVKIMEGKPVIIRTLDINGDKAVSYASEFEEENPVLGLRAIRYCLQKPEIFKVQIRAILRAAYNSNVRLLIPMISSAEEVIEAKRIIGEAAESLAQQGIAHNHDIKIGIMIEVPSAVIMADVLAEMVDFFSIGTNDLIQYIFAIDRNNDQVAELFNPLHPAVIRMLHYISRTAKQKGIQLFMCGEMAGTPKYLPLLLGLGLSEISMNPQSIPIVKKAIRSLSAEDAEGFVEEVLTLDTTQEIEKLIQNRYGNFLKNEFSYDDTTSN